MARPLAEVGPAVVGKPTLGDVMKLEQQHVPRLLALRESRAAERTRVADRQCDEVVDAVRNQRRDGPRDRRAPIMTDHMRALDADRVEYAEHIAGEERDGVRL